MFYRRSATLYDTPLIVYMRMCIGTSSLFKKDLLSTVWLLSLIAYLWLHVLGWLWNINLVRGLRLGRIDKCIQGLIDNLSIVQDWLLIWIAYYSSRYPGSLLTIYLRSHHWNNLRLMWRVDFARTINICEHSLIVRVM